MCHFNIPTLIVFSILCCVVYAVARSMIKDKKSGCGVCSGCGNAGCACHNSEEKNK